MSGRAVPSFYREVAPPPSLREWISCVWIHRAGSARGPRNASDALFRVVPDACADILCVDGGEPFVVGPASAAALVAMPAGTTIIGARILPGRVGRAFGISAVELLDRHVELAALWGSRTARSLRLCVNDAASIEREEMNACAERHPFLVLNALAAFLAKSSVQPSKLDEAASAAVQRLMQPDAAVDGVARSLGLGSRQLLRRVQVATGYGPKQLQRILRFQRLLVEVHRAGPAASLARLAIDLGYSDQAHMTREVVALSGLTPRELASSTEAPRAMSDFFKTQATRDS